MNRRETKSGDILYKHGAAPTYWRGSWGDFPYGRLAKLPRTDEIGTMLERWTSLERKIWAPLLEDLDVSAGMQILDIGCGAGKMLKLFQELGVDPRDITALDENSKLLEWCQEAWPEITGVESDCAQASSQPSLAERRFDLITANMLVGLLDDDQFVDTLKCAYDLLKQEGTLAFLAPSSMGKSEEYGLDPEAEVTTLLHEETRWGLTPYYFRSEKTMVGDLMSAGFDVISVENYSYYSFPDNTVHLVNALGVDGMAPKRLLMVAEKYLE